MGNFTPYLVIYGKLIKFFSIFPVTPHKYFQLLNILRHAIENQKFFRESIEPTERLVFDLYNVRKS